MEAQDFALTTYGELPAGTDVDAVLRADYERALLAVWDTYHTQVSNREFLKRYTADPAKADLAASMRVKIAELADVDALQALTANRLLVDMLTSQRWSTMRAAREAGASWSAIGEAMGMTKQGAMDWYKRKIADYEKYVPEHHDTARARAVLDGAE